MTTRLGRRGGVVLALLVAGGVGGWTLAARGQREHAAAVADRGNPEHSESRQAVTRPRAVADALLPAPVRGRGVTGELGIDRIEWTASPAGVSVEARMRIWESKPAADPFTWWVQIRRGDIEGEVVLERTYADQAFHVPADEVATPQFADAWDLPPGDYSATIELRRRSDDVHLGGPTAVRVP